MPKYEVVQSQKATRIELDSQILTKTMQKEGWILSSPSANKRPIGIIENTHNILFQ